MLRLVGKPFAYLSIINPAALAPIARIVDLTAVNLVAQIQPEACIDVIGVDHAQNETGKHSQISLALLAQILKHELQNQLLRLRKSVDVEYSEHLEPVVVDILVGVQARDCRDAVDEEVTSIWVNEIC